jgi:hypothetical protein
LSKNAEISPKILFHWLVIAGAVPHKKAYLHVHLH